jgi:membrane protease YdiL (CAAX protease family)
MDKNSKGYLYLMNTGLELAIAAGAIVMYVMGKLTFAKVMHQVQPIWMQALGGAAAGTLTGVLCGMLVTKIKFFSPVFDIVAETVKKFSLNINDIVLISLTAAVCEEMMFRGALQRMWGIWPVSVLFILLHGYFTVRNIKVVVYGGIMLLLSAAIGYSYQYFGMYAAVSFHLVFDVAAIISVKNALDSTNTGS